MCWRCHVFRSWAKDWSCTPRKAWKLHHSKGQFQLTCFGGAAQWNQKSSMTQSTISSSPASQSLTSSELCFVRVWSLWSCQRPRLESALRWLWLAKHTNHVSILLFKKLHLRPQTLQKHSKMIHCFHRVVLQQEHCVSCIVLNSSGTWSNTRSVSLCEGGFSFKWWFETRVLSSLGRNMGAVCAVTMLVVCNIFHQFVRHCSLLVPGSVAIWDKELWLLGLPPFQCTQTSHCLTND